MIYVKW